ncbi:hypothetical protein H2199_001434 [Coniosporium tulheliwenetii]|uniref:Uncharacterized protein n=1 Tax=Coniosporium tulheliwenetii TaxID=3383036 RepID=A0ACC2ZLV7_9PEZI|nr:hypothetical protein H2199_001434 [Cladosporium sp. JES 115]
MTLVVLTFELHQSSATEFYTISTCVPYWQSCFSKPKLPDYKMRIAEILSDLTPPRLHYIFCLSPTSRTRNDPAAALALVSARPSTSTATQPSKAPERPDTATEEDDPDLARAKDLVELHYKVKVAHTGGAMDRGLMEARDAVRRAVG